MEFTHHNLINNQISIYYLKGKLNLVEETESLLQEIDENIQNDIKQIALDCKHLSYINSSGLNVFIRILTKVRNAGGELYISNVNSLVERIFTISKLNQVFNIFPTTEKLLEDKKAH